MTDIFEFWKNVGPAEKVHPDDKQILGNLNLSHGLKLDCLPVPFYGPLKTAPIVLLYLNPGFQSQDEEAAQTKEGQEFWFNQRQGNAPLRSQINKKPKSWWVARTKSFNRDAELLRDKMAVLEICPYHSKSFKDMPLLAALPSCRTAIAWAQSILFPEAQRGERLVICLRSPRYWGLSKGKRYGKLLFAPEMTAQGGFMLNGPMRNIIVAEAQNIIDKVAVH